MRLGATDILGIDGNYIDSDAMQIPNSSFQPQDLTTDLEVKRQFDLAICLEVCEHLPKMKSVKVVDFLVKSAPAVLFSAAIPGQGGVNHVNEQWQSFWVERFREKNYVAVDILRPLFWRNPEVAYWYAQNIFLFVRGDKLAEYPAIPEASHGHSMPFDVVHPVRLEAVVRDLENCQEITIRQGATAIFRGLHRRILGN